MIFLHKESFEIIFIKDYADWRDSLVATTQYYEYYVKINQLKAEEFEFVGWL